MIRHTPTCTGPRGFRLYLKRLGAGRQPVEPSATRRAVAAMTRKVRRVGEVTKLFLSPVPEGGRALPLPPAKAVDREWRERAHGADNTFSPLSDSRYPGAVYDRR